MDEAFAAVAAAQAKAEKSLQNARDLFARHLQSVFTRRGPGLAALAELKQSLLHQAFSGEL